MIIIFTPYHSERLDYICEFIFSEQLGTAYEIISETDREEFSKYDSENLILCYGSSQKIPNSYSIPSAGLLFEKGIKKQQISVTNHSFDILGNKGCKIFFHQEGHSFPFDLFSSVFYLISRYEEYLPHEKDEYDRFSHKSSLAFQHGFLDQPLVNIWLNAFKKSILSTGKNIMFQTRSYQSIITYDIDMAWSYKNKGLWRNAMGFLKKPSLTRIKVLSGVKKDPFDTFDFLKETNKKWNLNCIYFFLVAKNSSRFDKNIKPNNKEWRNYIIEISKECTAGIHPSYFSSSQEKLISTEKNILADVLKKNIADSRQHYLRFTLPDTYSILISCGIEKEYSMGYGTINGFRASFAGSFKWYDLQHEKTTGLRIYPFSYMDANAIFEEKITPEEAEKKWKEQLNYCKENNGLFIAIFHNHLLTEHSVWRDSFKRIIPLIQQ